MIARKTSQPASSYNGPPRRADLFQSNRVIDNI